MQEQDQSVIKQQQTSKLRISVFLKIVVTLLRLFLYVGGQYFREYNFTSSLISIFASLGAFLLAEVLYWYKEMQGEGKEYSKGFTIVLHVGCLVNLLGMGFTFKYSDINPSQHYFLLEVGLLFNYAFSLIYLCGVYFNPPPTHIHHFLSIHEPVDASIQYIFIGLYIGSFFDMLAFLRQSATVFYILNIVLVAYLLATFLKSQSLANFKQAFTSQ